MASPIDNPHAAFCCVGCFEQYHRHRCVVCEGEIKQSIGRGRPRIICGRTRCRNELERLPRFYRPFSDPPATPPPHVREKTQEVPIKPGPKLAPASGRRSIWDLADGESLLTASSRISPPRDPWKTAEEIDTTIPDFLTRKALNTA